MLTEVDRWMAGVVDVITSASDLDVFAEKNCSAMAI